MSFGSLHVRLDVSIVVSVICSGWSLFFFDVFSDLAALTLSDFFETLLVGVGEGLGSMVVGCWMCSRMLRPRLVPRSLRVTKV